MYNSQTIDQITTKSLFSQFIIFNITQQIRTKCKKQQDCLDDFRTLPTNYRKGTQWTQKYRIFKPITKRIKYTVINQLCQEDFINNKLWLNSIVVTNNNYDRHDLNKLLIEKFSKRQNEIVIKWKKYIIGEIPLFIKI